MPQVGHCAFKVEYALHLITHKYQLLFHLNRHRTNRHLKPNCLACTPKLLFRTNVSFVGYGRGSAFAASGHDSIERQVSRRLLTLTCYTQAARVDQYCHNDLGELLRGALNKLKSAKQRPSIIAAH